MKTLFKVIFGTIGTAIVTAVIFVVSLVVGRSVTGTWDISKWNDKNKEKSPSTIVVTDYEIVPSQATA